MAVSALAATPKHIHLGGFIETIISRNGASAAGTLLEWALPRRVILRETCRYFATTVLHFFPLNAHTPARYSKGELPA